MVQDSLPMNTISVSVQHLVRIITPCTLSDLPSVDARYIPHRPWLAAPGALLTHPGAPNCTFSGPRSAPLGCLVYGPRAPGGPNEPDDPLVIHFHMEVLIRMPSM
jgi:hypothetical protein